PDADKRAVALGDPIEVGEPDVDRLFAEHAFRGGRLLGSDRRGGEQQAKRDADQPPYRAGSALWPGDSAAPVHPDHTPAIGLAGLRSRRQHTLAPLGTSIASVFSLRMTNWRVEIKPSPRLSQSAFLVTTISTLTRSQ